MPGLSLIPALAILTLKGCQWFYPLVFLLAAFVLGLVVALSCCALFGWLIRFVPAPRLKAAGLIGEALPWLVYVLFQFNREMRAHIHIPQDAQRRGTRRMLEASLGVIVVAAGVFGIRALSSDYLVRVAAIAHAGSGAKSKVRRSRLSDLVARLGGGQAARAGFEYLSRMMVRDWQFRRHLVQLAPLVLLSGIAAFQGVRISPFSGQFTAMHVFRIFFGDEAGVRSDSHAGTTWGVIGKTPVVPRTGGRHSLNMLSAVNARGELRFMLVKGRVNGEVFAEFLRRLMHNASQPVFLILDGHSIHRSRPVRDFVASQDGRLRLFLLPPYSPELNPDEQVWN